MSRAAHAVIWVAAGLACLAGAAQADEVVLANGDVLQGSVQASGDGVVLDHAVLGRIALRASDVQAYRIDPAASTLPALTRAPVPTEYVPCAVPSIACPVSAAPAEVAAKVKRRWDLAFTLGISDEGGNTEKFAFNTDIEGEYRFRASKLALRLRSSFEESNDIQTEGKYHGSLAWQRRLSPRGSLWALTLMDRDDFADLLIRSGWFVGYRHEIVQSEKTKLFAGLAAGYVHEERKDVEPLETAAFLALAGFKHEFPHGDTFQADAWATPYLDETQRSPMRLELRYAHPLRSHLDVTASFLVDYVPEPPQDDIKPWDTKFVVGLRWKP